MQQIIDFIIRKKDVVVYLILLLFSFLLIINSNYFHKSKILLFSNNITNYTFDKLSFFNEYFELQKINSILNEENLFLKSQLEKIVNKDFIDSLENVSFKYKNAKVISNNLSSFKNHFVIKTWLEK